MLSRKGGCFREKERMKSGERQSRWHSKRKRQRQSHRFSVPSDLNLDEKALPLPLSLFLFLSTIQLLIKGIRSFSPENEVSGLLFEFGILVSFKFFIFFFSGPEVSDENKKNFFFNFYRTSSLSTSP